MINPRCIATIFLTLALCLTAGKTVAALPGQATASVIDAARFNSLQAALNAVPTNGGIVRLPPGNFEIHEPLLLTIGETRIEGSGAATRIINLNTNGEPALILRPKDKAKNRRARIWRVQLGNFRISGNTNSGDGILADGINEIFIHGVSIDRNGGHGINLLDCTENPRVADSMITYNAKAGLNIVNAHDIVVNANHFEENQDAVRCIDGYNLCMNGNNVDDHLRHGIVIENTYGSVISGNMIEECDGVGIILDRDCYGITISANVIAHHQGGGIQLLDAWGCTISANTFVLVRTNALVISPNSGRITVTGNNFSNSYIGDGKTKRPVEHPKPIQRDDSTGILLQSTSDIVISGNQFSGLLGPAIAGEGKLNRLLITGNVITDYGRGEKNPKALSLGKPSNSVIKDNVIAK
ncbi:MAG: right-handed parallel beta-helix repeat-containing protein [Verrucomicrobia bacterium]|nr:right-handed parallel beta-helix repeat-containing protein [Verrucomicrobiota bacterium]